MKAELNKVWFGNPVRWANRVDTGLLRAVMAAVISGVAACFRRLTTWNPFVRCLKTFLWIGCACMGCAGADDPIKTQLEVVDGISGLSAPNAYRVLFVGDSITRHGVSDWTRQKLGWDHVAGMAASSPEKDYVHLLAVRIQRTMPDRKVEIYFDSQVTHETNQAFKDGTFAGKHARLLTIPDSFRPHLVVVQLGEHEQPQLGIPFLEKSCDGLFGFLRTLAPAPDIICAGVWLPGDKAEGRDDYAAGWGGAVENTLRATCRKYGIPFASVKAFALDPSCRGWGSSAGVKWHPNDKGMAGYARVLFAALEQVQSARPSEPAFAP